MTGSQRALRSSTRTLASLALAAALAPFAAGCDAPAAADDGAECEDALDRLFLLGAWTTAATARGGDEATTPDWFREAARAALSACPPDAHASVYACVADAEDVAAMRRCVRPPEDLARRGRPGHGAAPGTDAAFLAKPRHEIEAATPQVDAALAPLSGVDPLALAATATEPGGVALAALAGLPVDAPAIAPATLPRPAAPERLAPVQGRIGPAPATQAEAVTRRVAAAEPADEDRVPGVGAASAEPVEPERLAEAPSDRAVAQAVRSGRRAFHRCYAGVTQGFSQPPRVAYEVRLRLRGDGSVSAVDVASRRGDVPRLRACVQSVARRLSFDGRFRGEPDVRFPLIFSPGG